MSSVPRSGNAGRAITHEIQVKTPYRLDLTVSALRRTATNLVDVYTTDGRYLRALGGFDEPLVVSVRQPNANLLSVSVFGSAGDAKRALVVVRQMLGTDRDLSIFHRNARAARWLAPLARRMRGLKPPRYPGLFEACANAILFQQVSLHAASAIMRRLVLALGTKVVHDGVPLAVFPSVKEFLGAEDAVIRAAGLSAARLATLRRTGEAIASGAITEVMLEERSSTDAALLLRGIKGIGPWTAAVILLRGLGRLDVFPSNDSGVQATLRRVADQCLNPSSVVEALGSQRGMLYFFLLLARLEAHALERPARHLSEPINRGGGH